MLDTQDRRLIHALQLAPRAAWTDLAPVLGQSASALAKRWDRLHSEGLAWSTGSPSAINNGMQAAVVELEAEPAALGALVEQLREWPEAMTLDVAASGGVVIATCATPNRATLDALLLDRLPGLTGVRELHVHVPTASEHMAERWVLRALDDQEAEAIPRPKPPRARAPRQPETSLVHAIGVELGRDSRTPVSTLARRLGTGEQRISDTLAVLLHSGQFILRTDTVNQLSGWPVHVWYFADVPPRRLEALSRSLARLSEVRFTATSAGPANLIFNVWLRDLQSLHQLETQVSALSENGVRLRRHLILRTPKRLGHLLDAEGRHTGTFIPLPRYPEGQEPQTGAGGA